MSENFEIVQTDDVIAFDQVQKANITELIEEILESLEVSNLFLVNAFVSSLVDQMSISDEAKALLKEGIVCRIITPRKQGWTKGRLKLGLQFVPDLNNTSKNVDFSDNPLDDIRKTSLQ